MILEYKDHIFNSGIVLVTVPEPEYLLPIIQNILVFFPHFCCWVSL